MAKYEVVTGLNYGDDDRRAEPGDVVDDLPEKSVKWLLAQGHIKPVSAGGSKGKTTKDGED